MRVEREPEFVALLDEHGQEFFRNVIANLNAPWYLRLRRRVAFFVGHELGLVQLGYLIDYERDRYADTF